MGTRDEVNGQMKDKPMGQSDSNEENFAWDDFDPLDRNFVSSGGGSGCWGRLGVPVETWRKRSKWEAGKCVRPL